MKFHQIIQSRRNEKGYSLREFARRLELSPGYLSRIESEKVPPPSEDKIKQIAQLLELDPDELLAAGNKVDSDVLALIKKEPVRLTKLLRESATFSTAIVLGLPEIQKTKNKDNRQK